jgi:TonB family protein
LSFVVPFWNAKSRKGRSLDAVSGICPDCVEAVRIFGAIEDAQCDGKTWRDYGEFECVLTTLGFGAKLRYRSRIFIRFSPCMAHNPIFGSDPAKPASSAGERPVERGTVSAAGGMAGGSDLAELAAKFAVHGAGRVSPKLSADLALEIVLNEIVEQACLATRASGAALVLERDGEWVCRASAGSSAPQLGARLNAELGLSGACVKTQTVQRCDDAQNDSRVDREACRILGVRSVIVLPLLQKSQLAGIFEVFSTWPSAFGERDQRTLEALSQRVLRNLERASEPMFAGTEPSLGTAPLAESLLAASAVSHDTASTTTSEGNHGAPDRPLIQPVGEPAHGRKMDLVTLALSAAVLAYAVLLTVLVAQRLSGRRATGLVRPPTAVSARLVSAASPSAGPTGATSLVSSPGTQSAGNKSIPAPATASAAAAGSASRARDASPPLGGLLVYENGKEVFRMNPAAEQREATGAHGTEVHRAAALEPAGILQVSAAEAEGSLLHRVEPDYPEAARQQQIQGTVVLDLQVGQDGSVQEVKPVSGPPMLAQAATAAVKQWRFKPRLVSGHPTEMQTRITLNFELPR